MAYSQDEIDNYLSQIENGTIPQDTSSLHRPLNSFSRSSQIENGTAQQSTGDNQDAQGLSMPADQWFAFTKQHGGLIGTMPVDPTITTQGLDVFGNPTKTQSPNSNPRYRYQFGDGTYLTATTVRGVSQNGQQGTMFGVNITDGGTALKASKASPLTEYQQQQIARQIEQDRIAAANHEWTQSQAKIAQAHAERLLSWEQAKDALDREHQRIADQLTVRTQDITQRGQNLDMARTLADAGTRAAMDAMQYMAPAGTAEMLTQVARGFNPNAPALPSQPFPFDPSQLPEQIAARILKGVSPTADAIMAGQPQSQGTGFQLPPNVPPVQGISFGGQGG